ncbi:MAG: V-type ATP synthase subunit E family protein [Candidatus Korarchaeum sp.]|nr:V-type ATP synthase subunit E family protein [Candidatus Korarchaeum sp.]
MSELVESRDSEAIVRAILKIAEDRAEAIINEARRRANDIMESARREADHIIKSRREKLEREVRDEISRRRSAAEVEANQIILKAKKEIIESLIRSVQERLQRIADGEDPSFNYREILKRYCIEGIKALGDKEVYLAGREKDIDLLMKISEELEREGIKARVDPKGLSIIGGVVVKDSRDERRYYNTFDGRLRSYAEKKMNYLVERIFGGI